MIYLRKIISLIFVIIMFVNCSFGKTAQTVHVTAEGAIFGGDNADSVSLDLKFDTNWVTTLSNTIYNSSLAEFSAVLCDDVYFRSKDLAKGTQNRVTLNGEESTYSQTSLLEKLGYKDVKFIESFKQKSYDGDSNDSVTMLLGYKNVDNKFDSFIFVLRGCFSAGERLSVFDVGSISENYEKLTGAHPEWTDKNAFKGFDIAANRAMEFISDYISEHDAPERINTAFTTGHSRGASLANIIGARLEKDSSVKSYTYTFNTMAFTSDEEAPSYKTIFNIFDENDYYSNPLPFGEEKLFRYGRNISVDIAKNAQIKKEIATLKGRDDYICIPAEEKAEYDALFGKCFPDRASLYTLKTRTEKLSTVEEMNERFEEISKNISDLGFTSFAEADKNANEKTVTVSYCGAALLYGLAQIQSYGEPAYNAVISIFGSDTDFCRLSEIMQNNLAQTTGGHLLINGYVTAKYIKYI